MAHVPDQTNGTFIDDTLWNGNVDAINANMDNIASTQQLVSATQSDVSALKTTVNASGATAAGNAALSSRLGTGVTTSSTATSQLNALASRATALESTTGASGSGNAALASRVGTLETRTTDTSTGNSALGTRVTALEGGSASVVLVNRAMSARTTSITGGTDLSYDSTTTENQGGWTVSTNKLYVPVNGVYEFFMQVVWDSPATAGAIGTMGCYVTKNGSAGGANGLAANERASAANQTVMQAVGRARLVKGDYLNGRIYTDAATTIRGTAHESSYGGTYLSAMKVAP